MLRKCVLGFWLLIIGLSNFVTGNNVTLTSLNVFEGEIKNLKLNCSRSDEEIKTVNSEDIKIGGILINNESKPIDYGEFMCVNGSVDILIKGGHLGITQLHVDTKIGIHSNVIESESVTINVLRKITLFDELAVFILGPLILINKCAFGAKIEVETLKKIVTQPVEICICLVTQFLLLPLVAVGLGFAFKLEQTMALALLVSAACPGGGGGYVFSFLVDGDITLAITESLVSTLVAMLAMPSVLGLYTSLVTIPNHIVIPYIKILLMLVAIATPISLGMLLRRKKPALAKKLVVIIRPMSLFLIFAGLVIVVVTSKYVLYGPRIGFLLALIIPVSGFLIAIALAQLFSITWPLTKAIALEGGLKNTVLGVAVIELSFPQPQADLASILIIMVTVGQIVAAMCWYLFHLINQRLQQKKFRTPDKDSHQDRQETELFLLQNEE